MFQKTSYRQRIFLSFTLIFVVVFGVGGALFYWYNAELLQQRAEANVLGALAVVSARVDDRLRDMDAILKRIQFSSSLTEVAASIPDAPGNYFDAHPTLKSELNAQFLSGIVSETLSTQVYFISRYGDFVGSRMAVVPYSRVKLSPEGASEIPFVRRAMTTDDYTFAVAPRQNEWINAPQDVFSVVRVVRDVFHKYGLLEISQGAEELDTLCQIDDIKDDYTVFLLDEHGQQRYRVGSAGSDQQIAIPAEASHGVNRGASGTFSCFHRSDYSGWTLVLSSDFSAVSGSMASLRNSIIGIYLISCFIILGFFYFVSYSLTKPLTRLKDNLLCIEGGRLPHANDPLAHSGDNEVSLISSQIEHILLQIQKQNEQIMQTRKRELQAQMRMLEAQMDPHFLYNAMAVIGASAYEDGSKKAYGMLNDLADLLRYTIRNENQQVSLGDELRNIRQYLGIMQMRYEDTMQVTWEIDEALNCVYVPKLVLQPIVENCFKHGFKDQPPPWRIHIRTWSADGHWRASVSNDGRAFDREDVLRLDAEYRRFAYMIQQSEGEQGAQPLHFGLENTLKRLYLVYGSEAHYAIDVRHGWSRVEIGGTIHDC